MFHQVVRLAMLWMLLGLTAARADNWRSVADMANARSGHSATALASGRVFVVGGRAGAGSYVAAAEVYDPDMNRWAAAQAPLFARADHTATLLPSGQVLVVGGRDGTGLVAGAELYDPASDTWSSAGTPSSAREHHTATLLDSGQVLIAGGVGASGLLASAEVYDPATNSWATTGDLAVARRDHAATLMHGGEVLVTAGVGDDGQATAAAELYDPAAGLWHAAGSLASACRAHTATLLPSGNALVVGGVDVGTGAQIYDAASGNWGAAGSPSHLRSFHSATLLPSGRLLVVGGADGSGVLSSVESYDAATATWAPAAPLNTARRSHTATLLPSGRVLVAGGESGGVSLAAVELYDPTAGTWSLAGSLVAKHRNNNLTLLPDGNVLLIAGSGSGSASASAEQYEVATNTWSPAGGLATPRVSATATLMLSGKVLVAGGYTGAAMLASTEVYDPVARTASAAGNLAVAREYHAATLLPSGKVLVTGGFTGSAYLSSAELYDPASNTWSPAASLLHARGMHTATLQPSGKVLVAGGTATGLGSTGVTEAELYDPVSDSWSAAGQLASGRMFHTATLLPSGETLVAGGSGFGAGDAEIHDPLTHAWRSAGTLVASRSAHAAVLLPSGDVLLAGGVGSNPLASAERYDRASNTWIPAGSMASARRNLSAVALPTGDVLVAGGGGGIGAADGYTTSERFSVHAGLDESRRPVLDATNSPIAPGDVLELHGSGFTGDTEAGGGDTRASATNSPIVQWRRIEGELGFRTSPAQAQPRSASTYRSAPLPSVPGGHYVLTLLVNAVPSVSRVVEVPATYVVTPSAQEGGGISPAAPQFVAAGRTATFAVEPEPHHHVAGISGSCGGALSGTLLTTDPVAGDCTLVVAFAIDTFTLSYGAGSGGSIDGVPEQVVPYGGAGSPVTAVPDVGHHFVQWSDGSNANPRTDEDIVADVGVDALFAADTFVVTASASANGTIAPAQQTIAYGDHAVFTVEPDAGYGATLTGDTCDVAQTDASSWTTGPITVPCTVSATFALLPMAVLAINVTDERDFAAYGATLQYVVTVSNTGDAVATAVAVSNASPAQIDAGATTWTCTGAGSGAECQASGTGALETAGVVIPPGRTLVWHVTAPVLQGAGGASIDYAVSAGIGAGTPIEATDVDILVLLRNGFEAE